MPIQAAKQDNADVFQSVCFMHSCMLLCSCLSSLPLSTTSCAMHLRAWYSGKPGRPKLTFTLPFLHPVRNPLLPVHLDVPLVLVLNPPFLVLLVRQSLRGRRRRSVLSITHPTTKGLATASAFRNVVLPRHPTLPLYPRHPRRVGRIDHPVRPVVTEMIRNHQVRHQLNLIPGPSLTMRSARSLTRCLRHRLNHLPHHPLARRHHCHHHHLTFPPSNASGSLFVLLLP
jgi:hypothetical protein